MPRPPHVYAEGTGTRYKRPLKRDIGVELKIICTRNCFFEV